MHKDKGMDIGKHHSMVKKAGALAVLVLIAMIVFACVQASSVRTATPTTKARPSMSAIATPTK